ncbi:MAG: NDP-sugar synthase [Acidobacteriota bacterium]
MTDFFILAGGFGKRAEPLTSRLPKPLFPLNGKPLLDLLAEQMNSAGLKKGFINVHHLAPLIMELPLTGLDVTFIEEERLSGNRILSECGNRTVNDLLVINGDTFLDIPFDTLKEKIHRESFDGVILVRKKDGIYSSIISDRDIFIRRDKDPGASDLMYTGVSIFRNNFLSELHEENLFDSLEISQARIGVIEYNGLWLDLGTPETYFLSDRDYREHKSIPRGNSLSKGVSISGGAKVVNSIIWPDTKISGNAVISDSIVTGGLTIDSGVYDKKIISENGVTDLRV